MFIKINIFDIFKKFGIFKILNLEEVLLFKRQFSLIHAFSYLDDQLFNCGS